MNITIDGRNGYLQDITKDTHIKFPGENAGDISLIPDISMFTPAQKSDTFTKTESLTEKDLSDDVSTIEDSLDFKISEGMTREQLATHFGDLARKLDDEYDAGKYTEEEYNDLNEQLMEYYGSAITRCEQRAASERVKNARSMENNLKPLVVKVYGRRGNMTNIEKILYGMGVDVNMGRVCESAVFDLSELKKVIKDLTKELKSGLSGDQNGEEMTDEQYETNANTGIPALERNIDKYAAKYCATDRGAMAVIMDIVRHGGELLGGRDKHYGQDQAITWLAEEYRPVSNNSAQAVDMLP